MRWPTSDRDDPYQVDLGDLRASGAAVTVAWRTIGPKQTVLVVAAADATAVETLLRPQLGDRLCVVPSRWTRSQLDEVRHYAVAHWREWDVEVVSEPYGQDAQAHIEIELTRVLPTMANWADTVPDRLLVLTPHITPA